VALNFKAIGGQVMGTRSLTNFLEELPDTAIEQRAAVPFCTMYKQFDGYPTGLGKDLKEIIGDAVVVNGYGANDQNNYNGMGCLAASVISSLKDQIGNVYMYPPTRLDEDQAFIDYTYVLYPISRVINGEINEMGTKHVGLQIWRGDAKIYDGPIIDLDPDSCEI